MSKTNFDIMLNQIRQSKTENKLSHAFIVYGADEELRKEFAKEAVKQILGNDDKINRKINDGNFEDLLVVKKDGESIKVHQIESIIATLKNKPFSSDMMTIIIEDGDCIVEQGQNKLLKTLEEPSPGTIIIILVSNPELLAQTIRSRCVSIKLRGDDLPIDEKCYADAKSILSKALFQDVAMNDVFGEIAEYEDKYTELLRAMKSFLRDIVVGTRNESLISNMDNLNIVKRIKKDDIEKCRSCIYIIEETSVKLARGYSDKKSSRYIMRDMAVRIRQEANNG